MIFALLTIVHVIVCLILILVVLLQTGKRADLAGAFGGGGSQTAFGARGAATFLSKATTISAVVFMVTSLVLAMMSSRVQSGRGSVLDTVPPPASSAPAPIPEQQTAPPGSPQLQATPPSTPPPAPAEPPAKTP